MEKQNFIRQVLDDLYALDIKLKDHEDNLIKIIDALIKTKPEAELDDNYRSKLKNELLAKAQEIINIKSEKKEKTKIFWLMPKYMGWYSYAIAMFILAFMVPTVIILTNPTSKNLFTSKFNYESMKVSIKPVGDKAFGALSGSATAKSNSAVSGYGAGSGESATAVNTPDAKRSSSIMPPYEYKVYRYNYKGEEFEIKDSTMAVLKRNKDASLFKGGNKLISSLNSSYMDFSSLSLNKIESVNMVGSGEYPMTIYIDQNNGSISLSEYWPVWQSKMYPCKSDDQKCFDAQRVKIGEVPSDEVILNIANEFVGEHGVNMENYEIGTVDNRWRDEYSRATDKENYYIPDTISVIYPLKVDNKEIFNYSGDREGLRVNVNIKLQRVSGLWGLNTKDYDSSNYQVEQDKDRILKLASKGDLYTWEPGPDAKYVDLDLDTPQLIYLVHYNYNDGKNEELLIPVLSFPIKNVPQDEYFYKKYVVIPLVKEILDSAEKGGGPVYLERSAKPSN